MDLSFNLVSRCPGVLAIVHRHAFPFVFTWSYQAMLALGAGVLILIRPKLAEFHHRPLPDCDRDYRAGAFPLVNGPAHKKTRFARGETGFLGGGGEMCVSDG